MFVPDNVKVPDPALVTSTLAAFPFSITPLKAVDELLEVVSSTLVFPKSVSALSAVL